MLKKRSMTKILTLALTVLFCLVGASTVLAGDGNGTGGGKENPLALESSYPADGQKDVQLPVEIKLTFSKNVVNMAVKDKNKKAFTLASADGQTISLDVLMADDQVEPEKNQEVILKPMQDLKLGTAYKVSIAPELQSKSGATLGKQIDIGFETGNSSASTVETADTVKTNNGAFLHVILPGIGVILLLVIGFAYFKKRG